MLMEADRHYKDGRRDIDRGYRCCCWQLNVHGSGILYFHEERGQRGHGLGILYAF